MRSQALITSRSPIRLSTFAMSVVLLAVAAGSATVEAQVYPFKPIRVVVPAAPGGASDILARTIGPKLTDSWGRSIIVDHRAGANQTIGSRIVANAASDGYTLLIVSQGHASNPSLYSKLPYDTLTDFEPVTLLATSPHVLVVHRSVPANTIHDLLALAKAKPGQITFATSGVGSGGHLSIELLKSMTGVDMVHVPYKGGGDATAAAAAGQAHVLSTATGVALPQIQAGRLKALAVTAAKRSAAFPDLPTVAESGIPGYEYEGWFGVLAPGGTSQQILHKLAAEIARILTLPDVKARLAKLDFDPVGNKPEEFNAMVRSEVTKWAKVIKAANIKPEFAP